MSLKLKLKIILFSLAVLFLYFWISGIPPRKKRNYLRPILTSSSTKSFNKGNILENISRKQCGTGWQDSYIKLHREALKNPSPNNKYLIYYCGGRHFGCGGYGNRINAIVSLFLLAVVTDRVFLIDWNYSIPIKDYFSPNKIQWNSTLGIQGRRNFWGAGSPAKVVNSVRRPFSQYRDFKKFVTNTDLDTYFDHNAEFVTAMWNFAEFLPQNKHFKEKISTMGIGDLRLAWIGCAFRFLFTKTPELDERLRNARESIEILRSEVFFIGVHLRMGDKSFGKISKKSGTRTKDFKRLIKCALSLRDLLLKRNNSKKIRVFLATDDGYLKQIILANYKDIVALNVTIEHTAIFRKRRKIPSKEGMMGTLLDHLILAECNFLVLSHSSYGETAAGISLLPEDNILDGRCRIPRQ